MVGVLVVMRVVMLQQALGGQCGEPVEAEPACREELGEVGQQDPVTIKISIAVESNTWVAFDELTARADIDSIGLTVLHSNDVFEDDDDEGDTPCCTHIKLEDYLIGGDLAIEGDPNPVVSAVDLCDYLQTRDAFPLFSVTFWVVSTLEIDGKEITGYFCDGVNQRGVVAVLDPFYVPQVFLHEVGHAQRIGHRSDITAALMNPGDSESLTAPPYSHVYCHECNCLRRASRNPNYSVLPGGARCRSDAGVLDDNTNEPPGGCSVIRSRIHGPSDTLMALTLLLLTQSGRFKRRQS